MTSLTPWQENFAEWNPECLSALVLDCASAPVSYHVGFAVEEDVAACTRIPADPELRPTKRSSVALGRSFLPFFFSMRIFPLFPFFTLVFFLF